MNKIKWSGNCRVSSRLLSHLCICALVLGISPAQSATGRDVLCTETHGQVSDRSLQSQNARGPLKYRVYSPPCAGQSGLRYPYVILLAGINGDEKEWTGTLGIDTALDDGIVRHNLPPMILIMPEGGYLMGLNAFPPLHSWESLIVNELIPAVETSQCVQRERSGRAIGGISRGAFWAFEIALAHQNLFTAIGGHSPVFDQTDVPPSVDPLQAARLLQAEPSRSDTTLHIWLDTAANDLNRVGVEQMYQTLQARGIAVKLVIAPDGDHSEAYWQSRVSDYLRFYGAALKQGSAGDVNC